MTKHGDTHYFDIGPDQFECIYDEDYKKQPLWYSSGNNYNYLFNIDTDKGFRSKEACENYIKQRVKITCKKMLKDL